MTIILLSVVPVLIFVAILGVLLRIEVRRKGSWRAVFANNALRNPIVWTHEMVGSAWRYRLSQVSAIILAIAIGANVFAIAKWAERGHVFVLQYVAVGLLVFVGVVQLPLTYLRALRRYVTDARKEAGQT